MTQRGALAGELEAAQVRSMFDGVAAIYDALNGAMTAGLHHRWRARAADLARVGPGSRVLDVATGTGDLALELARRVAPGGEVVGSDFSEVMLARAREKGLRAGAAVDWEWGDALELPYANGAFDAATVGFGARNFSDLHRGLAEMARVVRPGGRVVVLEMTTPTRPPLSSFFGLWFDRVVPLLGRLAATLTALRAPRAGRSGHRGPAMSGYGGPAMSGHGDPVTRDELERQDATAAVGAPTIADAYTYLPNSVRRFPGPVALAAEMERAGLTKIAYLLTAGGIIAIHAGVVPGGERSS